MAGCSQTFLKICVYFNFVIVICLNTLCNINQPCDVIDWTPWSPCSTTGEQSSKSIICCTGLDKGRCLRICSLQMRPEMKERKRNCIPRSTPYVYIVPLASTRFITSRSKTVRSFTENATSAFHPSTIDTATKTGRVTNDVANENQTIDSFASTNAPEYEKSTSDVVFDNILSSKGNTEIFTTDTSDISITRTTVQSSTSLYQEKVVASEYQMAYSSNAAENVVYTSDQTFNKQSITEERSGTSVTLTPETSNYRTFVQTSTGEKATSSHEPGYEFTSNRVNNSYYSTQEGTEYHVKSEASNARTSVPSSTSGYQGKGNGTSNASQLSRNRIQEEGGIGGGVIAGAIIGVLAVAGLSGLLAFFLYRRWKKNKEERKVEPEENGGENPVSQKPPASTSLN